MKYKWHILLLIFVGAFIFLFLLSSIPIHMQNNSLAHLIQEKEIRLRHLQIKQEILKKEIRSLKEKKYSPIYVL